MRRFWGLWFILLWVNLAFPRILNYPRGQDIVHLDPAAQWNNYTSEVLANVYEGLVEFKGERYKVSPLLAERWEMMEGGRVWRFYLRRGIRFHDGSPFNADSVVFTFKRQKGTSFEAKRSLMPFLKDVRKVDDYTVDFELAVPCVLFPYILANPFAYIVKPYKDKFLPIGTGPFKVESWVRGKFVLLKANRFYWRGRPRIEGVRFYVVRNPYLRVLQLRNGNADVLSRLSRKEYEDLKNDPRIDILKFPVLDLNYITFNVKKPPFNDIRVRKAITYLINRERLVRVVFGDLAEPVTLPLPPSLLDKKDYMEVPKYDPEAARKLLREAGYKNGLKCTLYYLVGSPYGDVANALSRSLLEAGVIIKPVALPYKVLTRRVIKGDFEMAIGGWVADYPEAGNFLYSIMFPLSPRVTYMSLPQAKELLLRARGTLDEEKRRELYAQVVKIILKNYLTIPLYRSYLLVAYRKGIKGIEINPKGYLIFYKVRVK